MRRLLLLSALIGNLGGLAFGAALKVSATSTELKIDGIAPGASVALLSAAHEPGYYMSAVVSRREVLVDDDRDGTITVRPPRGIPFRSVWMVVDLQNGQTAIATRPDFQAAEMAEETLGHGKAVNIGADVFDVGRSQVDIVVVRPGRGAWSFTLRGKGTEIPTARGRERVNVAKLRAMRRDGAPAPDSLSPGDIVIMLDLERLEYSTTRVTGGAR